MTAFYQHLLYRFFDAEGVLLYIGRTNDLRRRFDGHSRAQPWWDEVVRSTVETLPDLPALKAAEKQAILDEHPKYNIVYNGRVMICDEATPLPEWLLVSPRLTAAADALHEECRAERERNYPEEGPDDSPACVGCTQDALTVVRAIDTVTGEVDPHLDTIATMLGAEQRREPSVWPLIA